MKYVIITRSLQTDFQWEQDAINIAQILLELLSPEFPLNRKDFCEHIFVSYVSRYVADGPTTNTGPLCDQQNSKHLQNLLNRIEHSIQYNSQEAAYFRFSYNFEDLTLLYSLIKTAIAQYYFDNKPILIEQVRYLKMDYGDDLIFINHSKCYNNLTNNFYAHGCEVFNSKYNEKKQILKDFETSYPINDNEKFEVVIS